MPRLRRLLALLVLIAAIGSATTPAAGAGRDATGRRWSPEVAPPALAR